MKNILFALVLTAVSGLVSAQKVVNDPNAEVRTISSFHALHVSNSFDVILTQGSEESLAVSANSKEDMASIRTVVEDGVLKIWFDEKNKWWPKNRKLRAYVSVKKLDELKCSGSSDVKIEGSLNAANLKLDFSGAKTGYQFKWCLGRGY